MFKAIRNEKSEFLFETSLKAQVSPFEGDLEGTERAGGEVFFLAWTTTPWTLPSNLGLTVGPDIEYVLVKTFNPYTHLPINVILAKDLISIYFKPEGENGNFSEYKEGNKV